MQSHFYRRMAVILFNSLNWRKGSTYSSHCSLSDVIRYSPIGFRTRNFIYIYIYIYITFFYRYYLFLSFSLSLYIYIYIEREREGKKKIITIEKSNIYIYIYIYICIYIFLSTSETEKNFIIFIDIYTRGVMVIVIWNGHGDSSSNPGRDWLHFT